METEEIYKAVKIWQQSVFHPLTCGNVSTHGRLFPIKEDGKVILCCPDCNYTQENIPKVVLDYYEKEYKNEDGVN